MTTSAGSYKSYINKKDTFYKQASIPSSALLAYYEVTHTIAKCNEPPYNHRRTQSTCCCRYDEPYKSAGFSALALMESKYRSKINVEKEISSLIPRFEKMRGDQ